MTKSKSPTLIIILYVLAGLFFAYFVWSIVYSINYISTGIAAGQLSVSGNEYEVANFYMSNSGQYAFYAIVLFVLGWMLHKSPAGLMGIGPVSEDDLEEDGDEDEEEVIEAALEEKTDQG